jgi:hypothetical protein
VNPIFLGTVKINAVIDHGLRQGDAIARMWEEKSTRSEWRGTAVVDFETEGEKQWKVTPVACRAAGVPFPITVLCYSLLNPVPLDA